MTEPSAAGKPAPAPARHRPPLGLPSGSVRALLTLLIVAVVIAQVARGQAVEPLWVETLMIALAHNFTSRRFVSLPPELVRRLEAEGHLEEEANQRHAGDRGERPGAPKRPAPAGAGARAECRANLPGGVDRATGRLSGEARASGWRRGFPCHRLLATRHGFISVLIWRR